MLDEIEFNAQLDFLIKKHGIVTENTGNAAINGANNEAIIRLIFTKILNVELGIVNKFLNSNNKTQQASRHNGLYLPQFPKIHPTKNTRADAVYTTYKNPSGYCIEAKKQSSGGTAIEKEISTSTDLVAYDHKLIRDYNIPIDRFANEFGIYINGRRVFLHHVLIIFGVSIPYDWLEFQKYIKLEPLLIHPSYFTVITSPYDLYKWILGKYDESEERQALIRSRDKDKFDDGESVSDFWDFK